MNLIRPGSVHPSAQGWRPLSRFADPVFDVPRTAQFQVVAGAGQEAHFLGECIRVFVVREADPSRDLGWQPPPAAQIPVVLAGRGDAEWSLEPDEMKF
jgi:hypothetical protein